MCGIFGFSGEFNQADLETITDLLDHRGPDDRGIYRDIDSKIALLQTRLSIIDLSPAGHQPMVSPCGNVIMVFNGEIYNYLEIRSDLVEKGVQFNGHSDSEVILHLYLEVGTDFVDILNGIFSIAIFDKRNDELLIYRDGIGVKPLYYMANESGFIFSSEIKALKPFFDSKPRIDFKALEKYLTYLYCPGNSTSLSDIKKIDPGHIMTVKKGKITGYKKWFTLPQTKKYKQIANRDSAILKVQEGLRKAVHRQMIADVPVGSFLSGGLDSSAIVAFAKEINPDIKCFTIESEGGTDKGDHDDLPYAIKAAEHLNVDLKIVKTKAKSLAEELEKMIWHLDEPLADPAALNVLYISKLARENGIKVLLSGAGGDDLFTGYRRHLALNYEKLWTWLPNPLLKNISHFAQSLDQKNAIGYKLNKLLSNADATGHKKVTKYFSWAKRDKLLSLYSERMKKEIENHSPEQPLIDFISIMDEGLSPLEQMLGLEQRFFLADHNLNYTDKMSMAVGVEVRVPFLDYDLLEISAKIPNKFKQNGSVGKWVLKKAMEPYLPDNIIYRPKSGFGAPIRRWIRDDLKEMIEERLSHKSLNARGIFDPIAVQKLIEDNDRGLYDGGHTIFSILCIETWFRLFVDKEIPPLLSDNEI
tara:strand:- start:532 stop:2460 length:1929 start_codon:yes stop_codon:yes gene_type:complete